MMNFLVVIEDNRGSVHRMSLEAIAGRTKSRWEYNCAWL